MVYIKYVDHLQINVKYMARKIIYHCTCNPQALQPPTNTESHVSFQNLTDIYILKCYLVYSTLRL